MDLNSTAPLAPPMQAGVSARWLWVAIAALAVSMAALAGAWMMMPGFGVAHAADAPAHAKESSRRNVAAALAAQAAQGIQAPEHMDSGNSLIGSGVAQMSSTVSGLGIAPAGSALKLSAR